jgi:MFS family permease
MMKNLTGVVQWVNVQLFFVISIVFSVMFGVYSESITQTLNINQAQFGWLAGVFFVFFAIVQFYSGKLLVKIPSKILLFISALISAIGCFLLAVAPSLTLLFVARILLGIGLASTYVGVLFIVQKDFEAKSFPVMSSLSQCLANLAGAIFAFFGGIIITKMPYQTFFIILGVAFLVSALLILIFIKNNADTLAKTKDNSSLLSDMKIICKNAQVWWAALFFTGLFSAVISFANLLSTSYQMSSFGTTMQDATAITSMILLGVTIGSLLSGLIAKKLDNYAIAARIFAFISLIAFCIVLFVRFPTEYFMFDATLVYFIFGFGLGGSVMAFQCIQENVIEENIRPLATSFILTIAYVFVGFIEQPLIGQILNSIQTTQISPETAEMVKPYIFIDFHIHDNFYKYAYSFIFVLVTLVLSFIASLRLKIKR